MEGLLLGIWVRSLFYADYAAVSLGGAGALRATSVHGGLTVWWHDDGLDSEAMVGSHRLRKLLRGSQNARWAPEGLRSNIVPLVGVKSYGLMIPYWIFC